MDTDQTEAARRDFIQACQRAFNLGLQVSTGGNLSARLDEDRFLVKPSGLALYELEPGHLLISDGQGRVLSGRGQPTKELSSHLAIYQARPDVNAVVHYHPPHATAFAVQGRELPLHTVHAKRILGAVPLVNPPGEGGSEMARALAEVFSLAETRAALLAQHGIIAAGRDLRQAQNLAELVEESARIAFLALGLGRLLAP